MDNFQKLIIGSSGTILRRDPKLISYDARETGDHNLLLPPIVPESNPYKNFYQMAQEDNQDPFTIGASLYDPDKMIKSAKALITTINGVIIPIENLRITRVNLSNIDTMIEIPNLNGYFDTANNPQPEFSVILEITLRNNKKIILDEKHFMRYMLSGPGSYIQISEQGSYKVYDFFLYVDGVLSYQPQDINGATFGFAIINANSANVPDGYYNAIIEVVDRGRTYSYKGNTDTMEKLNFRPDVPDNLPVDKITPLKIRVSIYNYGLAKDATVEIYAIRDNKIMRQFAINNLLG